MTHPELTISLARISDVTEIAAMSRDLIEHGLRWSWIPERVAASVRSRHALVIVARGIGHIAGFGIMRYGDEDAHLDLLGVAPQHRRAGLGRRLVEWLEKPALIGGMTTVVLEVRSTNHDAQAFYHRLGYRQLAYVADYYQGREAAVRMRHELGPRAARTPDTRPL